MGLMTVEKLREWRGYFIVIAFVVAAIITPPDVVSQLALAIPMCLLYEAGILAPVFIAHTQAPEPDRIPSPSCRPCSRCGVGRWATLSLRLPAARGTLQLDLHSDRAASSAVTVASNSAGLFTSRVPIRRITSPGHVAGPLPVHRGHQARR